MRAYRYVGPADIKARSAGRPGGREIRSAADVVAWIRESAQTARADELVAATFVVDTGGRLLVADRRAEHVACAGGGDVLAAGEVFFAVDGGKAVAVVEVTNLSTGYCPEPACWTAVESAFARAELDHPPGFTTACVFRKCPACGERNLVKDGWYYCEICGAELPAEWNFC
jgi:hypothetical protein